MRTYLTVPDHVRPGVELVRFPMDVDVRLTPESTDGTAWSARLLTFRAKALFDADEIVVGGPLASRVLARALVAGLVVD